MRLSIKRGDDLLNELRFSRGPVYIGRQIGSQIFLPDRAVSRQHTVIYTTTDGKWVAEDLDSANKTYLNDEPIHKAEIKNGDVLRVADFYIEIHIEQLDRQASAVNLEDTLHATLHEPQVVLRHLDSVDAPLIRMHARRGKDFSYASSVIFKCNDLQNILTSILDLVLKQFKPFHIWAALRKNPAGAMELSKGKKIGGETIAPESIYLEPRINEAVKNHHYILIPRLPMQSEGDKIHSAIIAPIMCDKNCFGVIYIDNSLDHEHYSLSDMDYLVLLSLMLGGYIKSL